MIPESFSQKCVNRRIFMQRYMAKKKTISVSEKDKKLGTFPFCYKLILPLVYPF